GVSRNLSACPRITRVKQPPLRKAAGRLPEKLRRYAAAATGGGRPYSFVTLPNVRIRQGPTVFTQKTIRPPGLCARPLHASASSCILAPRFLYIGVVRQGEETMQSSTALEAVLKRDRLIVLGGLAGVTALAWAYTGYLAWSMDCMHMAMPYM